MEKNREQIFLRCCLGYFFSGMATLIIGATLPHLMKEIGLDYIGAGSILTFFYIGNFFGSFLYTALSARLGDKFSITLMTCLSLLSFVILINTPPLIIINILMLILGLTKGSISAQLCCFKGITARFSICNDNVYSTYSNRRNHNTLYLRRYFQYL